MRRPSNGTGARRPSPSTEQAFVVRAAAIRRASIAARRRKAARNGRHPDVAPVGLPVTGAELRARRRARPIAVGGVGKPEHRTRDNGSPSAVPGCGSGGNGLKSAFRQPPSGARMPALAHRAGRQAPAAETMSDLAIEDRPPGTAGLRRPATRHARGAKWPVFRLPACNRKRLL